MKEIKVISKSQKKRLEIQMEDYRFKPRLVLKATKKHKSDKDYTRKPKYKGKHD